jgi:hypothetical protein
MLISFLMGIFMGTAIPTTSGQTAEWDVLSAGLLLLFTEIVNRLAYGRIQRISEKAGSKRSLLLDMLNFFKIGLTYSLYLEAFKLGS